MRISSFQSPSKMTPILGFACRRIPVFAACGLFWIAIVGCGSADLVTVTNTTDDALAPAAGSLRKAITDATDGDTIQFDPAVTGTITLAGAELVVAKTLTIAGPGAANLAISGNAKSR